MSKRAITLCKIVLQLMIITKQIYAIIGGLRSGGLKSGELMSGGLMSGGLKSAHRRLYILPCLSDGDTTSNVMYQNHQLMCNW